MSQRALAERALVAQSEIARIESGRQEPSFHRLEHLLRAAGYDLKIQLVPHDDHDEQLIRQMLALPVEKRLDSLEEQSEFFAGVREVPRGARGNDFAEGSLPPIPLRPRPLLEALVRHRVRFIILGGVAERMLGSPRTTDDFDICPATSRANLGRLAGMLNEVEARWAPPGSEEAGFEPVESWNAASFKAQTNLALVTAFGKFDIWFRPDGTAGYDDLIKRAVDVEVGGLEAKAVHLEDSMRIKRAIGGPKYLGHLPLLRDLQRQRRERGLD